MWNYYSAIWKLKTFSKLFHLNLYIRQLGQRLTSLSSPQLPSPRNNSYSTFPLSFAFRATVCKTVRPVLSDRCLSVLSCLSVCPVCNVGVLSPNAWMDQDVTWHPGTPRSWPHCVRWGPIFPSPSWHSPRFSAKRLQGWIKMALGMEVVLGPGHSVECVTCGSSSPIWPHPQFSAHICCGQTVAHLSYCWVLVHLYVFLVQVVSVRCRPDRKYHIKNVTCFIGLIYRPTKGYEIVLEISLT